MISPLEFISHHPKLACVVNSALLFGSYKLPELTITVPEFAFPLWLMQLLQIGAWAVSIMVGAITILAFINKNIERYKKRRHRKKAKQLKKQ